MSEPKFTPGPWRWVMNRDMQSVVLTSDAPMRPIVMKFWRWGMQHAAPTFRDAARDLLKRAEEWFKPRDPGGEYGTIDHPDAILIQTAPELYATLEELVGCLSGNADDMSKLREAHAKALQVLAKARGETPNEGNGERHV